MFGVFAVELQFTVGVSGDIDITIETNINGLVSLSDFPRVFNS